MNSEMLSKMNLPEDLKAALSACPNIWFPETKQDLYELCFGTSGGSVQIVGYTIPGLGYVQEAEVVRCKNGASVNFTDEYMRRRDPNCMYIGDEFPTDKPRFRDSWGMEFGDLRAATMSWFSEQSLIVMPAGIGGKAHSYSCLVVCPANAAFFAYALSNIQEFESILEIEDGYTPRSIIYVAPPFRHTHFGGKQAVVHCRSE